MATGWYVKATAEALRGGALFSTIYISLILTCLIYFNQIYQIGKRDSWWLIVLLIFGEILKAAIVGKKPEAAKRSTKVKPTNFTLRDIWRSILAIIISIIAIYSIAVLFGAPFFSEQEETFMFALLTTVLVTLPLLLNLGPDTAFSILSSATAFEGADTLSVILSVSVRVTLFGAWLGATVIPLDWDRPWQAWPIPCSIGAILGSVASQLFVLALNLPKVAFQFDQILIKRRRKYEL